MALVGGVRVPAAASRAGRSGGDHRRRQRDPRADRRHPRASSASTSRFRVQFLRWARRVLHGDLGISIFSNAPVATLIGQRTRADALARAHDARSSRSARAHRSACWPPGRPAPGSTAASMVVRGARLLGAGVRGRLSADLSSSRSSCAGCRCRAIRRSPTGSWPWLRASRPAVDRARPRLCGADRAHHARHHARRAGGGLHPHRAGQGRGDRARCC